MTFSIIRTMGQEDQCKLFDYFKYNVKGKNKAVNIEFNLVEDDYKSNYTFEDYVIVISENIELDVNSCNHKN